MTLDPAAARGLGTVRIVGTGLLGASVGLGLRSLGVPVLLADPSPTALALACDLGAGEADPGGREVDLVVVAAPPDVTGRVVVAELAANPGATVTDVASVKAGVAAEVAALGADGERYVGGHPMAGRERSGAVMARGDLFLGRPWVICPQAGTPAAAEERVRQLALALGAVPVVMPAAEHDRSVAVVSHLPQVAASLVAAQLRGVEEDAVGLAGQGLRDVTRIAAGDPTLWAQILAANAGPVAQVLGAVRDDLDQVIGALTGLAAEAADGPGTAAGARATLARAIAAGNQGRDRIPGKHGGRAARYAVLTVAIPDRPGALGELFVDIGKTGINVEELSLEHVPGRAVGLLEVSVLPGEREALEAALDAAGWRLVS